MDLQIDQQSELIRQSLDRYLSKQLPFEVRARLGNAKAFLDFWRTLENELGIAVAGLAEDVGGFGGGPESEMVVATALGRALAVTPYIPAYVLAANVLGRVGQSLMLQDMATGKSLIVVAVEEPQTRGTIAAIETMAEPIDGGWRLTGKKLAVEFAQVADIILVPARVTDGDFAIFALKRDGLGGSMKPFALIDETPAADLLLEGYEISEDALLAKGDFVLPALAAAIDRAIAAYCAEAFAIATVMVEDTVAYTKEREQFGTPIAAFQALQHRMVDMLALTQEIEAASLLATLKCEHPEAISAAKVTICENLRKIGQEAVQLHGAMGLTEELRVGHYFKRATVLEHKLGNADHHIERYRKIALG